MVGHPQAESAVQLGAVAWVGVAEQAEQIFERLGDGADLIGGHALRRRLGEAEPRLCGLLDSGGFGDPAGDQGRVAARVERRPIPVDLSVGIGDGLAQLIDLTGVVVGGERGSVLRVRHAAKVVGQVPPGQRVAEKLVDRADDRVLAQVEGGWMADLVLADEVAARGAAVVEASVVRVADHLAVAQAAGDQPSEEVGPAGVARRSAHVAVRAALLDRLLSALVEVGADQRRV